MNTKSTLGLTLGSAFIATVAISPVADAAQNPFAMQKLDKGYMVAEAATPKDSKAMEMNCGASMKGKEAKCGATKTAPKAAEAKCGADKKPVEGKCGAAK